MRKARQRNATGSSQILSNSFDIQQLQYSMARFAVKQNGLHLRPFNGALPRGTVNAEISSHAN